MSKRPAIDLSALTSESAAPMAEAPQRTALRAVPAAAAAEGAEAAGAPSPAPARAAAAKSQATLTENLQGLSFKVPAAFRKRFRQRAANADLKLNELLFAALDAWEEKNKL